MPALEVGIRYFTYDALNRRSSLKDEVGQVWYFDYDSVSNLSVQRNPLAAFTYWEYDPDNRKVSQKDPLGRTWYWTYDAAGNVNSMKDGRVQVTYYQVDSVYNRVRVDYPDLTFHYFEYDLARQMTAFADLTGRTVESYDNLGRATFRGNPGSQNLYYEYDAVGNRTSLKDPDGYLAQYTYDAANRMTAAATSTGYGLQPYGQSPYGGYTSTYEYSLADQRLKETRANGAISYYGYDAASRVSLIQHRKADGTQIDRYDYTRDEFGNITYQLRADGMRTYWNYDQASRITKEAWRTSGGSNVYGFDYQYDAAGNRQSKVDTLNTRYTYWEYDLADQLTKQKSGAPTTVYFEFDSNGNLSVEHDVDAGAGRTYYDYDPKNLLSRIDFPGAIATNYFYYNAATERARKDDSTGIKKYTWDGLIPIVEKNASNSTTQRMVKGYTPIDGIGDFALQESNGTVIYPHKNQVGTTLGHTDGNQALTNYYEYDAWGQPLNTTETTPQQYRFTGKELDPDFVDFNSVNRRYHFLVRGYSPFRGRFNQLDPLAITGWLFDLLHGYSRNNPTRYVDPRGLIACSPQDTGDAKSQWDTYFFYIYFAEHWQKFVRVFGFPPVPLPEHAPQPKVPMPDGYVAPPDPFEDPVPPVGAPAAPAGPGRKPKAPEGAVKKSFVLHEIPEYSFKQAVSDMKPITGQAKVEGGDEKLLVQEFKSVLITFVLGGKDYSSTDGSQGGIDYAPKGYIGAKVSDLTISFKHNIADGSGITDTGGQGLVIKANATAVFTDGTEIPRAESKVVKQ